jgi:hypothetical protein
LDVVKVEVEEGIPSSLIPDFKYIRVENGKSELRARRNLLAEKSS